MSPELVMADQTALCILPIRAATRELSPAERELTVDFTTARALEFVAGRQAAHEALAAIGLHTHCIGRGLGGEPLFPKGIVGSISHTRLFAVAAVARQQACAALGVDLDDGHPFDRESEDGFTWDTEVRDIQAALDLSRQEAVDFAFSAKEAVYKCQYGLPGGREALTPLQVRLRPTSTNPKYLVPDGWRANSEAREMLSSIRVARLVVSAGVFALATGA
jgi:4'-phosphopantetheinyl transferase EntD